jgi:predicted nicotinamide N-methyase
MQSDEAVYHIAREQQTLTIGQDTYIIELIQNMDALLQIYADFHPSDEELIPYFAELWPASIALATYMDQLGAQLYKTRVLELGCGLGIPSLIASRYGAQVIATDYHPHNAFFLQRNALLNNLTEISYKTMDWANPLQLEPFDWVIGSDLIYTPTNVELYTPVASQFVKPNGTIILTDPGRSPLQQCSNIMKALGFNEELFVIENMFVLCWQHK